MAIWKIDGVNKDSMGRKNENDFNINLIVRGERWGVQLDVEITPLYCMNCNTQIEGLFKHDGSRYGQVGTVQCNYCEAKIHCTDHDNIVENLNTFTVCNDTDTKLILDYYKLYDLEKENWAQIETKTGYDIIDRYKGKTITLDKLIKDICKELNINLSQIKHDYLSTTSNYIKKLPAIVNKWRKFKNHIIDFSSFNTQK